MKALKNLFCNPLESKGGFLVVAVPYNLIMLLGLGSIVAGDLNVITVMFAAACALMVNAVLAIFYGLFFRWHRDDVLHPEAVEFKSFADNPITRPLTNIKYVISVHLSLAIVMVAAMIIDIYETAPLSLLMVKWGVIPLYVLMVYAVVGIGDLLMRYLAVMSIWKKKHQKA